MDRHVNTERNADGEQSGETRRPTRDRTDGPLARFEVEVPDGPERGLRIGCSAHDEWTEFDPGRRSVAFACEECGLELSVRVDDLLDWRDWGEMC